MNIPTQNITSKDPIAVNYFDAAIDNVINGDLSADEAYADAKQKIMQITCP